MEMEILKVVGDVGGPMAVAAVVWLYLKLKAMEKRLDDGELRFSKQDEALSSLKDVVGKMSSDVSFIRGIMEGRKNDGH